ncbi:MAG: VanZ family protein [Omnitrophica bacterium]|nr:VanZ family protein [Candidatus Omnitrophota bacterium]
MKYKISKTTIGIGLFIIVSASFSRQILALVQLRIGERGVITLLGLVLVISGLAFLIFAIRNKPGAKRILMLIAILTSGLYFSWQIKIPVERIHLLEYALLGWFAARDLIKTNQKAKGAILACTLGIAVGIVDELFQAVLPYRVFELRDIVFNGLGTAWGIALYFLS